MQLIAGLGLILVVVALSAGMITAWSTRRQITEDQLRQLKLMGRAVATLVAPALTKGKAEYGHLRRAVSELAAGPYLGRIEVVDRRLGAVAVSGGRQVAAPARKARLRQVVRTERQMARVDAEEDGHVEIITPVYMPGPGIVVGAVVLDARLGQGSFGTPLTFWWLMAIDGLVLLLFVGVVTTRYVVRPIGTLQQAASRVAAGDLDVKIAEEGADELASLAESFNSMTASLRDQLQRLERQRRSLVQSEKLASVGRLAAGVAHEVGNPLQSIIGFTELLLQGDVDVATRADFLRRIQDEAARIRTIIGELLDFSRPMDDEPQAVELERVVDQAFQLVRHQKRFRQVELEQRSVRDMPPVVASTSRLVQVLLNLLLNAADAMGERGQITVAATCSADTVELRVSNTGAPIATEDRERIFDPFFTTKEPGQGTGLGLAVAQSIAESFGGRLILADVGDAAAQGTTFVLMLRRWL